jgi:deoxycytidine triphosphate deaminase
MIKDWGRNNGVTPFHEALVNPASLDLCLGNTIRRPHPIWEQLSIRDMRQKIADGSIRQLSKWGDVTEFSTEWLMPGEFVLLHSLEFVRIPPQVASILVLKSSRGRDGYNHSHSGWGDPGFGYPRADSKTVGINAHIPPLSGAQWTFEIQNISPWPIELVAGTPLIQMVLMDMADEPMRDYRDTGHYVYQAGPTVAHEVTP